MSPQTTYQYKYLQGNVEATLDLANLFGRFNPRRTVNPFLFAGVGLNGAFDNDEANALNDSGYRLGNIWSGSKVFVAGRLGLGVDFRFSDCVSFGVELNTNMLSDKYNSKKAGNLDWQFNALAGFTFRFGKNYKKSRPAVATAPVTPARTTEPAQKEEPAVQEPAPVQAPATKAAEKPAALRENIFFRIGSAQIRTSEQAKVAALAEYLKANPARIEIVGYADAATGSHALNLKLPAACRGRCSGWNRPASLPTASRRGQGRHRPAVPRASRNRVSICMRSRGLHPPACSGCLTTPRN
ncbi:MAG: OmpA family protein [Alistipes finegoldii]